jgi:hypothetical protein
MQKVFIPKRGGKMMAKYILVEDKNLVANGTVFKVLEEDSKYYVVDGGAAKMWIPKDHARVMPDHYEEIDVDIAGPDNPNIIPGKITVPNIGKVISNLFGGHATETPPKSIFADQIKKGSLKWGEGGPEKVEVPKYEGRLERTTPELSPEEVDKLWNPKSVKPPMPDFSKGPFLEEWPTATWNGEVANEFTKFVDKKILEIPGMPEAVKKLKEQEQEIHRLKVVEHSLRKRSRKKGRSNADLSAKVDRLMKTIEELDRDFDITIEENRELKRDLAIAKEETEQAKKVVLDLQFDLRAVEKEKAEMTELNEHHKREVEKGNEYREGQKKTITSLHEQIRSKDEYVEREITLKNAMESELNRFKRIVDRLLEKRGF